MDYRIYGIINDGITALVFADADGLVTIREAPGAPLINLTQPASNRTIDPGAVVQISWTSDLGGGGATVTLFYDDDDDPTDPDPGTVIANGIDPDVQSTYTWVTPEDVGEEYEDPDEDTVRLYLHARITNAEGEDRDTAAGILTVRR
jgi:hypothetical protein